METKTEKKCIKCGETKPLSEFYVHKAMKDGRLGKCKVCQKRAVSERYGKTRPARSAYEKERSQRPERKAAQVAAMQRHRSKNPAKYKARTAVNNALRDGRLHRKPCQVCGAEPAQAHHADYAKPLEVEWFCFKHHREDAHGQVVVEPTSTGRDR